MNTVYIPENILVNINGVLYVQDRTCANFECDDVVLDKNDGTHAVVAGIMPNGNYILRDGMVSELNVNSTRLIKLNLCHKA